ncbi:hypothetical protein HYH02_008265 [Chlamydomonas schloesseri]|uniref:RING-type E3 ubiquitin transferase n=1 Tax=Chlamydomonas schloesseri TaxID=2026947 RepID=A0A835WFP5_9CHLO|nr:hypothetical protein HYH02_008265 [Chlamydomonas schloesseri]|eukprot:KAG2446699.1 hypothetical protein HYH02_008265 [Chlamydomonas schloesseri]
METAHEVVVLSDSNDSSDGDTCSEQNRAAPVFGNEDSGLPSCPICLTDILDPQEKAITGCQHTFCRSCLGEWLRVRRFCPLCKRRVHRYVTGSRGDGSRTEVVVPPSPPAHEQRQYRHPQHPQQHEHHHYVHHVLHVLGLGGGGAGGAAGGSAAAAAAVGAGALGAAGGAAGGGGGALSAGEQEEMLRELHRIADSMAGRRRQQQGRGPPRFRSGGMLGQGGDAAGADDDLDRSRYGHFRPSRRHQQQQQPEADPQPRPYYFRVQQRLMAAAGATAAAAGAAAGGAAPSGAAVSGDALPGWQLAGHQSAAEAAAAAAAAAEAAVAGATGSRVGAAGGSGSSLLAGAAGGGAAADPAFASAAAVVTRRRVYDLNLWATGVTTAPPARGVRAIGGAGGSGSGAAPWRALRPGAVLPAAAGSGLGGGASGLSPGRRELVEAWVARDLQALLLSTNLTLLRALVSGLIDAWGLRRDWAAEHVWRQQQEQQQQQAGAGGRAGAGGGGCGAGSSAALQGSRAESRPEASGSSRRRRFRDADDEDDGGRQERGRGSRQGADRDAGRRAGGASGADSPDGRHGHSVREPSSRASTHQAAGGAAGTADSTGVAALEGPVAALQPFLFERAAHFWHEMRCYALSGLSASAYDACVRYGVGPPPPPPAGPPEPPHTHASTSGPGLRGAQQQQQQQQQQQGQLRPMAHLEAAEARSRAGGAMRPPLPLTQSRPQRAAHAAPRLQLQFAGLALPGQQALQGGPTQGAGGAVTGGRGPAHGGGWHAAAGGPGGAEPEVVDLTLEDDSDGDVGGSSEAADAVDQRAGGGSEMRHGLPEETAAQRAAASDGAGGAQGGSVGAAGHSSECGAGGKSSIGAAVCLAAAPRTGAAAAVGAGVIAGVGAKHAG